jgi:hypothetical protein
VENETLLADLPAMVELGLQKIYGYQHNDGGPRWWRDDINCDRAIARESGERSQEQLLSPIRKSSSVHTQ